MPARNSAAASADASRRALDEQEDYTLDEVASHFRVSRATVHNWVKNNDIGHYYAGRFLRFRLADIQAYKESGGARRKTRSAPDTEAPPSASVRRRRAVA